MLLATDLDGTFLRDDKTFDKARFASLLAQWQAAGHHFVVASGRELNWIENWFGELLPNIYVIASNGAVLQMPGQELRRTLIDPAVYADLQGLIDQNDAKPLELHGFTAQKMYFHQDYKQMDATNFAFAKTVYEVVYVADLADIVEPMTTITGRWSTEGAEGIIAAVNQSDLPLFATTSGYGAVDILPAGVNKAATLSKLLAELPVTAGETMAVGDGMNDLEMLKFVDQGFIMPRSDERLLAYGFNQVETDNNHDGVLELMASLLAK